MDRIEALLQRPGSSDRRLQRLIEEARAQRENIRRQWSTADDIPSDFLSAVNLSNHTLDCA
jgi:hypothetical protein